MQAPRDLDSSSSPKSPKSRNWLTSRLLAHPWKLLALFVGIILPLGLAAKLADDILDKETLRFDEPILFWLHARSNPIFDHLFVAISLIGGFPGTAVIGTLGALRLWLQKRIRAGWFWGLSIGGSGALNMVVKLFFHRDRPTLWASIAPEHDYSFPSGHSMLSASIGVAVLLLLWPTRWRRLALVFAVGWPLIVGLSRLYIGVHFPSDVLAGWCAGAAWTTGVYFILRGERDRFFRRIVQQNGAEQVLAGTHEAAPATSLERLGNEKAAHAKIIEAARQQEHQQERRNTSEDTQNPPSP